MRWSEGRIVLIALAFSPMPDDEPTPDDDEDGAPPERFFTHEYDPLTDSASEELVNTVAAIDDTPPRELEPLGDFVDPDALDTLFRSRSDGSPRDSAGEVSFEYIGYLVNVSNDGAITVRLAEESRDESDGNGP